ncbi:MAG: 50S ribosomal protein L25, partial [Phycisphaerae bacterium]
ALDGVARSYLIKSVQYDHLGHEPIHVDLARVDMDERVTVNVGIELRGVPKGVSEGGVLDQQIADIEISCRVTDIPETLHPVVTALGLGESLLVKDLELPPGVTALAEPDARVATVRAPAAAVEEEAVSAEAEEAAAQPERIGRVREEEASSEASS